MILPICRILTSAKASHHYFRVMISALNRVMFGNLTRLSVMQKDSLLCFEHQSIKSHIGQ